MTRTPRALPLPALSLLSVLSCVLMTGCGTERATVPGQGAEEARGPDVGRRELAGRARALGTELDMVYVTEVPGYRLAAQSVGVHGDHGFEGTYVASKNGGMIRLVVDTGAVDGTHCTTPEIPGSAGQKVSCASDHGLWYRTSLSAHEYAFQDGTRVIRLSADRATVKDETLRQAAHSAHRAGNAELDAVLPKTKGDVSGHDGNGHGGSQGATERGDLPTTGDGAPQDPPGLTEGTSG
ncbi:hypothetical protein [Streptomyces sp. NPDC048638]|uniref:hypothetical protein n=1 Tax=Streptomyces sp. NPDC048638 TaxID=3365580 RepID=UPI00371D523C